MELCKQCGEVECICQTKIDSYKVGEASCDLEPFQEKGFEYNNSLKWVRNLYVPQEHRKQGLAEKLLKQLGKEADAAQINLILECRVFEHDAIPLEALEKLYKRNGFVEVQAEPKLMLRIAVPPYILESLKQKPVSRIITNLYS
jgi:GNAT superfamily N-acetyltransferase